MAESAVGSVVVVPTDCLLTAFREVLKDDGFNVPSQAAVNAVKCAEQLIEWSCEQENKDMVARFASDLVTEMLECFDGPPATPRTMRERMWGKFFDMRSSIQYKSRWSIISINWEEEESHLLKDFIVDHWITVRGFSYANAFLEKYKQASKKAVQKSKGLRKQLVE